MGCASSKDADEIEKKKGKKKGEAPFDRPGIRYIDDQMPNNQVPVSEVTPHDASLQNGTEGEAPEANGVKTAVPEVNETQVAVEVPEDESGGGVKVDTDLHIREEGDEEPLKKDAVERTADEIAKDVVASALQSAIAQEAEKAADKAAEDAAQEGKELVQETSQTVETVTRTTSEGAVETVRTETTELSDGTKKTVETVVDCSSSGIDQAVSEVKDALNEIPQELSVESEGVSTHTVTRTETTTNEEGVTEKRTTTITETIGEDGVKETKTSTVVETVGSNVDSAVASLIDQLKSDADEEVPATDLEGTNVDQVVEEIKAAGEVVTGPTAEEEAARKQAQAEAIDELAAQLAEEVQKDMAEQVEVKTPEPPAEPPVTEDAITPVEAPPPPPLAVDSEPVVTKEEGSSVDAPPQPEEVVTDAHQSQEAEVIQQEDVVAKEPQGDAGVSVDAPVPVPEGTPVCQYKVSVFTGDKFGAGTDANVLIALFGEIANSGERVLDNKKDNFERGKEDNFTLDCPSLGPIKMLHIGHDNSGPSSGWYLDKVVVEDCAENKTYEFPCQRWFAVDEDDGQCTRALWVENAEETPQEGGIDPAAAGAQLEDRFYNNQSFKKPDIDASDPQQQDAALRIQTKYRQFHAKKVVQSKREEKAATKIQAGFRGMHDRHKVKELKEAQTADFVPEEAPAEAQAEAPVEASAPPAEEPAEPTDLDLNDPLKQEAAVKIQAGFKGYKARKEIKQMKVEKEREVEATTEEVAAEEATTTEAQKEPVDIDLNDPSVQQAATKIQAGFKGMKARQDVKAMKEASAAEGATEAPPADDKPAEEPAADDKPAQESQETVDINLEDPEVQQAATKIQAAFRGMEARREVKEMKEHKAQNEGQSEAEKPAENQETAEAAEDKATAEGVEDKAKKSEEAEPAKTEGEQVEQPAEPEQKPE